MIYRFMFSWLYAFQDMNLSYYFSYKRLLNFSVRVPASVACAQYHNIIFLQQASKAHPIAALDAKPPPYVPLLSSHISRELVEVWNLFNFFCAILDRWWHLQGYLCSLLPNYVAVADLHTPFNSPVRQLPFSVEFSAKACGFWTSVENTKKYHFPRTLNSHFLFQQKINKVTVILTNEALYRYFSFSPFIYRCVWWTS